MNAPLNLPIDTLALATSHAPNLDVNVDAAAHGAFPADESLLATLAFVRDCLNGTAQGALDTSTQHLCREALEGAFSAAMKLERTVLHQTRHIEDMARVACTDHLTGAYNRRGFEQEFQRALAAANRYDEIGVLVYIDLDGFKPINDTYGHAVGDQVLSEVAQTLINNVRTHDVVARIGGDEYAVLLTRTSWKNGLQRAEVLKHLLNTLYVRCNGKNIAVRASFGVQRFGMDADADALLSSADSAMYEAKRLRAGSQDGTLGAPR